MPTARSRLDLSTALFGAAAVAGLHPLVHGITYGDGDHDDLLPPVLARLDPGLFVGDVYVQSQLDGITVRTAFHAILTGLGHLAPLPVVVVALHVLTLAAAGAGLALVGARLTGRRLAGVGTALLAGVAVPAWTLGGNAVVYGLLTPEGMAWPLVLVAIAGILRGRWAAPGVLLGLAAWLHALAGLLSLGALALAWAGCGLRRETPTWRPAAGLFGLGLAVAAPLVVPALVRQSAEAGAALPYGLDAFRLYAELRFPHHLLPTAFGPRAWASFGLLAGLGGLAWAALRRRGRSVSAPVWFAAVVAGLAAVATVGILGLESLAAARAQVFKLTVLVNVVACAGLAGLLASAVEPQVPRWSAAAGGLALLVAVGVASAVGARAVTPAAEDPAIADARRSPRDAVWLVPPSATAFRVGSERAAVATWKAVPFRADLAAEWARRLGKASDPELFARARAGGGLLERLDAAYAAHSDEELRRIGAELGATHVLVPAAPGGRAAPRTLRIR